MKKANRRGRGGSYFQATPGAERVFVAGTDQQAPKPVKKEVPAKAREPLEAASAPKAQSIYKGAE